VHLLESAQRLLRVDKKLVFLIVGDGPLRGMLEREGERIAVLAGPQEAKGCGVVVFAGVRRDMPDVYGIMDVFVLPSVTEGLPMALLEAVASKIPVVATGVGGIPRIIEEGLSGRLVDAGDPKGLAAAIEDTLADPKKSSERVERAYDKVKRKFSSANMARRYTQLYAEILDSAGEGKSRRRGRSRRKKPWPK